MRTGPIIALASFILAACAGQPMVAQQVAPDSAQKECARVAQLQIPGGHGAYGGFRAEEPPYYLQPSPRQARVERKAAWVDPYYKVGEEAFDPQAYRACLLHRRSPGDS